MDERLFSTLARWLADRPVVLASVASTQGATPRKCGSRMLIGTPTIDGSVGGGLAEAHVIAEARKMLGAEIDNSTLMLDLGGGIGAAGICGGRMHIVLRRWSGAADCQLAGRIAESLAAGRRVPLDSGALGTGVESQLAIPNVRLLIIGAGHCGAALSELAQPLDFEIHVFDSRAECLLSTAFSHATTHCGDADELGRISDTERDVQAVLLNRNFEADVAALRVLGQKPPRFIGMLGSHRRITEVRRALPELQEPLRDLVAPIGLDIGAETPHEIAISILAQLIEHRRRYR
ncbi:MAG: XdhC family protein [Xanthomonadales bacterium]|nr:XdhC family protein [Xanthomonadales bacterium]